MKWISLLLLFLLVSCSDNQSNFQNWMHHDGRIKVLCTTAMVGDLVREIGGEQTDVLVLIKNGLDPHSYTLVKGDDEKLVRADLIVCNGVGLEHGPSFQRYLAQSDKVVSLGDWLSFHQPSRILYHNGQPDPHIWTDVALFAETIPPIVKALSERDPAHSGLYEKNGANLKKRLLILHESIRNQLLAIPPEKRYLISSHNAFNYFARAYLADSLEDDWQKRYFAPEGLSPESQLSHTEMRMTLDRMVLNQIRVLFAETNVNSNSLRKLVDAARELGLSVSLAKEELFGDAMGEEGSETGSYIGMMAHNGRAIARCLGECGDE